MTKYIGMDAHSSICVFSVIDENGVEISQSSIATNGALLVDYIRSIPGSKCLVFEECELSSWLFELLRYEVDKLIVCNPVMNKQYKHVKTDKLDAKNLAQLLRGGYLSSVYHDGSRMEHLRTLMSGYQDIVETGVSLKNRYKSLFRKSGLPAKGSAFYSDDSLLTDLPRPDQRFVAQGLYRMIEAAELEREKYYIAIKAASRNSQEAKLLKAIPGIGEIHAVKIASQVISAERFKDKHKFWSYCGLVRHKQQSAGKVHGSKRAWGNRILKCAYKMAAKSALTGENEFRVLYEALRARGVNDKSARNAVCRKIAAISLSMLKNKSPYDSARVLKREEQAAV